MSWREESNADKDPFWKTWKGLALPRAETEALEAEAKRRREAADATREMEKIWEAAARQEEHTAAKTVPWGSDSPASTGKRMQVFDRAEAEGFEAAMAPGDSDQKKRKEELVKLLRRRGEYRRLATIPEDWRERLDEFAARFPNVGEAIEFIRYAFALAEQNDRVPRLMPLLLAGDPGVGKTHFARSFPGFLRSGYTVVPIETMQAGSALAGSQEYWTNTKPGIVFAQLIERDWANPVVVLEELDKADVGYGYGDPRNALYQLFEPATAREFRDLSVPQVAIDASRIIWVATANEPSHIPAPLLSRMRHFEVEAPTREQSQTLARGIFADLRNALDIPNAFADPSQAVIDRVAELTPRRIRQVLEEALGRALYAGRSGLLVEDVRLPPEAAGGGRRVGFV